MESTARYSDEDLAEFKEIILKKKAEAEKDFKHFKTQLDPRFKRTDREAADKAMGLFMENAKRTEQLINSMPTNRELINKIYKYGFQKI